MEDVERSGGSVRLVEELGRVLELVRQLDLHMQAPDASIGLSRHLAAQIVVLIDRSVGIAAAHFPDASTPTPRPHSGTSSPLLSDVSHQPFRTGAKKRKATDGWTSQVRVSAEGLGDDGHSWRKYGQKEIHGAKHPRGYYRCSHLNSQGCAATKKVQRADEDPALFDVVYHGEHTCRLDGKRPPHQHNPHAQSLLQSLSAGLTVDTGSTLHAVVSPPPPPTTENRSTAAPGVLPSMASPAPSDSNGGLSTSPYPVTPYGEWPSYGELQEVMSAAAAVSAPTPAPAIEAEFMPYYFEFDSIFDMDAMTLLM